MTTGFRCLESSNTQFEVVFDRERDFEDAKANCLEKEAFLSHIDNQEEFDFVKEMIAEAFENSDFPYFYVGLFHSAKNGEAGDPTTFDPVQGFGNRSFYEKAGNFPWHANQPDSESGSCVWWTIGLTDVVDGEQIALVDVWFNSGCDARLSHICRKDCSTEQPSQTSTESTGSTESRSFAPTEGTSLFPTALPSANPTALSSATPTALSSATPTALSSATPTALPSATPTVGPSLSSYQTYSPNPTALPSFSPSLSASSAGSAGVRENEVFESIILTLIVVSALLVMALYRLRIVKKKIAALGELR